MDQHNSNLYTILKFIHEQSILMCIACASGFKVSAILVTTNRNRNRARRDETRATVGGEFWPTRVWLGLNSTDSTESQNDLGWINSSRLSQGWFSPRQSKFSCRPVNTYRSISRSRPRDDRHRRRRRRRRGAGNSLPLLSLSQSLSQYLYVSQSLSYPRSLSVSLFKSLSRLSHPFSLPFCLLLSHHHQPPLLV